VTQPLATAEQQSSTPVGARRAGDGRAWNAGLLVPVLGLVALLVTAVVTLAGGTMLPLALVVGLLLVLAVGQRSSWMLAVAAAPVLATTALLLGSIAWPKLGIDLTVGNVLLCLLGGIAAIAVLVRDRSALRLPGARALALAGGAALPSIVMVGWYAVANASATYPKLAWLMNNDAVWNLAVTRTINLDGGFLPGDRPNVSPGTFIVMAAFTDPGRSGLPAHDVLAHDLTRVAWALLAVTAVASILFGLVAAQLVPARFWVSRLVLAAAVGLVPWTWAGLGFATRYGFWNAILTPLVLASAWLIWQEAERAPRAASALMALVGLALLSIWVPLIILPGLMGVAIVLRHWRTHLALRGWALVAWLAPLAVLVAWYVLAMRPAFSINSTALGFDGAMFLLNQSGVVVGLLLTFAVGLVAAAVRGRSWSLVGAALVLGTGALGMYYLMKQREGAPTGLWGYYPAKFAWLVLLLAVPIAVALAASLITAVSGGRLRRAALVVGSVLVALGVVVHIPPADPREPTSKTPTLAATPDWRPVTLFPIWSASKRMEASAYDPAVADLEKTSVPGGKAYYWDYFREPAFQAWANNWLVQLGAYDGSDPIRGYAFAPPQDLQTLCTMIDTWQGEVTLVTRDAKLGKKLDRTCPDSDFEIDVR